MKIKLQSKKALSAFLFAVPMMVSAQNITIDETNFPDENFRAYLLAQDYGQDGILTEEEVQNVIEIDVYDSHITSLKGLEFFTALKELDCSKNALSSLDVSKNTELEWLWCYGNPLFSLDISKNTKLVGLSCYRNNLTSIDVSNNIALEWLGCNENNLTSLDISKNIALEELDCSKNQLTSLDVSNNPALWLLECYNNKLTSLDVSHTPALKELNCYYNELSSLDLSNNPELCWIRCYNNKIEGASMDAFINSLPPATGKWAGYSYAYSVFIYNSDGTDNNVCTKNQVATANSKGWTIYKSSEIKYEGMDEADGITQPNMGDIDDNAPIYNLVGQKVESLQGKKGVYIVDGKKVFIK